MLVSTHTPKLVLTLPSMNAEQSEKWHQHFVMQINAALGCAGMLDRVSGRGDVEHWLWESGDGTPLREEYSESRSWPTWRPHY